MSLGTVIPFPHYLPSLLQYVAVAGPGRDPTLTISLSPANAASLSTTYNRHAGGVTNCALHLPKVLRGVLAHLLPVSSSRRSSGPDDDECDDGDADDDDDDAGASAGPRSDPYAAALVNRTWCAAALPLLWACPTEEALCVKVVTTLARRAWYASLIRTVHISRWSLLWQALAGADVQTSNEAHLDDHGEKDSSIHALRFPRLTALHVKPESDDDDDDGLVCQAPLVQCITPYLHRLSCHLTDAVVD